MGRSLLYPGLDCFIWHVPSISCIHLVISSCGFPPSDVALVCIWDSTAKYIQFDSPKYCKVVNVFKTIIDIPWTWNWFVISLITIVEWKLMRNSFSSLFLILDLWSMSISIILWIYGSVETSLFLIIPSKFCKGIMQYTYWESQGMSDWQIPCCVF